MERHTIPEIDCTFSFIFSFSLKILNIKIQNTGSLYRNWDVRSVSVTCLLEIKVWNLRRLVQCFMDQCFKPQVFLNVVNVLNCGKWPKVPVHACILRCSVWFPHPTASGHGISGASPKLPQWDWKELSRPWSFVWLSEIHFIYPNRVNSPSILPINSKGLGIKVCWHLGIAYKEPWHSVVYWAYTLSSVTQT